MAKKKRQRGEETAKRSSRPSASYGNAWTRKALLVGLALLPVMAHLNALNNPFVYDDASTVVTNPSIQSLSNLAFVLVYERFRPMVNLSYAVDFHVWGLRPFGFHLTNLALHVINVLLLFTLARHLQQDRETGGIGRASPKKSLALPALVAGIFAVHPMMTEAVGYISGRAEVLCGVFFLSAWLCLRRTMIENRKIFLVPALLFWCLALASKEVAVMLPAVAILYDVLFLDPERRREYKRWLWLHLPLLTAIAFLGGVRAFAYLGNEASFALSAIYRYILTETVVFWRYVGLLLFPAHQSVVHSVREMTNITIVVLAAVTGLALVVGFAWRLRRRWPVGALGAFWFLLLLLPTSVLPLRELMAEHRVYLASCGFFLLVGESLDYAARWLKSLENERDNTPATVAAIAILCLLAIATVQRNAVWVDPETLWRDAATKAGDVNAAQYQLGNILREKGDCEEAITYYRRAIELVPDHWNAWNNLGICLASLERYDEARQTFQKAIELQPDYARAHNNLGTLAKRRGLLEEAREHFLRALELDPGNSIATEQLNHLSESASMSVEP